MENLCVGAGDAMSIKSDSDGRPVAIMALHANMLQHNYMMLERKLIQPHGSEKLDAQTNPFLGDFYPRSYTIAPENSQLRRRFSWSKQD